MIIGDGIMLGAGGATASIFVTGLSETDTVTASKDGKTVIGKWTQIPNPVAHGLPDGYTELEYIESTGSQYIGTEFTFSQNKGEVDVGFSSYSSGVLFGSYDGTTRTPLVVYSNSRFVFQIGENISNGVNADANYHDVSFYADNGNAVVKIDGVNKLSFSYSTSIKSTTTPGLFCLHRTDGSESYSEIASVKLYYAKYHDGSNLLRHFIPCKRNSDSAVGMYDLVTNAFFGNSGTGIFVAGPEIPQTIDGFLIDKIKDYGTWTVTATDGTNTATIDVLVDSAVAYNVEISYRNIDENIVLLIDGNNIEDISTYQRAITNNGVTLSDAQTKFFDKSLYFNGSAILQFDAYTLGANDFTIDFWMYNTSTSNAYRRWITGNNGGFVSGTFCIRETSSGVIQTQNVTSSTNIPRNQWVHIAAVRSNGTLKIYLNGTEIASTSDSTNYSEAIKYIGGYYTTIGNETFQGYMDEIRISNIARWTSNFTPPTRPY